MKKYFDSVYAKSKESKLKSEVAMGVFQKLHVNREGKRFSIFLLLLLITASAAVFMLIPSQAATTTYFVTEAGNASKDGSNWDNAMGTDEFLTKIDYFKTSGTGDIQYEFLLKTGTYAIPNGRSVYLPKNVKLYGGFNGTENSLSKRSDESVKNMMLHPLSSDMASIISGDGVNNYSLITGTAGASSDDSRIDGFTITSCAGTAMLNTLNSSQTTANCTFIGNKEGQDSLSSSGGSQYIINCAFVGNKTGLGRAIVNQDGNTPVIEKCTFTGFTNGAVLNKNCAPVVRSCTFRANRAANNGSGGAVYNDGANAVIESSAFVCNTAYAGGGAIYNKNSSSDISACAFSGNSVTSAEGGAIYNESSAANLVNCTFSANPAKAGGGAIYSDKDSKAVIVNCTLMANSGGAVVSEAEVKPVIVNSVFRLNNGDILGGSADVRYSFLEAGYQGGIGLLTSGEPKLIAADAKRNVVADPTGAGSCDVRIYIISCDKANPSSLLGEGLAVGESVSGDVKVPEKDQLGNKRRIDVTGVGASPYYVDLGAYQFSSSIGDNTPSVSLKIDKSSQRVKSGDSVTVLATTKPINFIRFEVSSSDEYEVTSEGKKLTITAKTLISSDIKVRITAKHQLPGSGMWEDFTLLGRTDISGDVISPIADQVYTGRAVEPDVTVTVGGIKLTKDDDYTASYTNNINPGRATVTIMGIGDYTGTKSVSFTIKNNWLASSDISWYDEKKPSYTITTNEQLAGIALLVNSGSADMMGKTITVSSDIDLTGAEWTPIGTESNPFNGTLDGKGSSINGLVTSSDISNTGFIGATNREAVVQNITISADVKGMNNTAVLVGLNNGTIINCKTGGASSGGQNIGGIAGLNNGIIRSCVSETNVTGTENAGGIAGSNSETVQNSVSAGNVSSAGNAGGIVGSNRGTVNMTDAVGETTGAAAGGITGYNGGAVSGSNWLKDGGGSPAAGSGTGDPVSGDCEGYDAGELSEMPTVCVLLNNLTITSDRNGSFTITAASYPTTSDAQITFEAEGVTFTPPSISADGTPKTVKASGGANSSYTVTIKNATGEKLAEFKLTNKAPRGGNGGCNSGFAALAALSVIPVVMRRKKK